MSIRGWQFAASFFLLKNNDLSGDLTFPLL